VIFYIVEAAEWALKRGDHDVAMPGLDGLVHCCDEGQLAAVAANYFPVGASLVALAVDPTKLESETRYEPGAGGEAERFPHVFGPISAKDVVAVSPA
jgi:uncharacterized protein (DUF952 family)